MWGWTAAIVLGGIAAIAFVQHRMQRGRHVPLSQRQPPRAETGKVPLGMEATDLDVVASAARRNESLERGHTNWTKKRGGFFLGGAELDVKPWADDETYARRYHAAFKKSDVKDK
ncbi:MULTISPECIES: hypothetical protein [Sulfitobacter]|jgi:hypothetical protein|uniref:Uncharacterized protein n=1 Tax=Sulfitobacter dubius TaxID=218673 RepID=A0ABY3ZKR5_9RHOB|nr:hypothetical protein [Sulfitobacter dubius]UOA15072.1 hypothetical protein DSM109990_01892 [Sulfitobacter dubius]WOI29507.1 hypothetical protein R1T39_02005 [Sulfitobacter dubius]